MEQQLNRGWQTKYCVEVVIYVRCLASNLTDFMAALARNSIDTTSYDFCTKHTQHLTVVENTVAVLFPSLPVVGYAITILEGMNKAILVSDVGVESVALKASFNPT